MTERFFVDPDAPYDPYVVIPTDKSFVFQLVKDFHSRFEGHVIDLPAGTLLVPHDPLLHFIDRLLEFIARTDSGSLKSGRLGYPFPPDATAWEPPAPSAGFYWVSKPSEGFRYGDEMYEYGQVVQLRGAPNDPLLLDLHYVLPVDPTVPLATCSMCGARFIQERWCIAHSKKRHGSAAVAMPLTEVASTVEPEAAAHSGAGRYKDAEWRSWSLQDLLDMLKTGWKKARERHPKKKPPSFQDVADEIGYSRRDLGRSMKRYHYYDWETIRQLLND